jgi:hypothetical protein
MDSDDVTELVVITQTILFERIIHLMTDRSCTQLRVDTMRKKSPIHMEKSCHRRKQQNMWVDASFKILPQGTTGSQAICVPCRPIRWFG